MAPDAAAPRRPLLWYWILVRVVMHWSRPSWTSRLRKWLGGRGALPWNTGCGCSITIHARTDVGRRRTNNEDSWAAIIPEDPSIRNTRGALALIADGMGGHAAGEVASKLAADRVVSAYFASLEEPPAALAAAFQQANEDILAAAQQNRSLEGMGTTCTALVIRGAHAWFAHVGDSRLYRCRAEELARLTNDHSEVARMVRCGQLTEEQARRSPLKNIIHQSLGASACFQPDVTPEPFEVEPGDRFLLCSDGLHDLLTDEEIAAILRNRQGDEAIEEFIKEALRRGAPDNVTVGLVEAAAVQSKE